MESGSPIERLQGFKHGAPVSASRMSQITKSIVRQNAGFAPPTGVPNSLLNTSPSQQNLDSADVCSNANIATDGTVTTVDGVTLTSGMVVLLVAQTDATQNGLWNVTSNGNKWTKHITATSAGGGGGGGSGGGSGTVTNVSGTAPISVTNPTTTPVVALTGTIPATNMPGLTGDVTCSAGSIATTLSAGVAATNVGTLGGDLSGTLPNPTIAAGAVTSSKMGSGAAASNVGTLSGDLSGTLPSPTIANNAVTNAKAAQMGALTLKGNNTGSTANQSDLNVTQVKSMLSIAASDVSGLAAIATSGSASDLIAGTVPTARLGSGTANNTTFLRGDQSWVTIPAGGIVAYVQKSASYTVLSTDGGTFFDVSTSTAATLTLPTGVSAGFTVWMRKADNNANFVALVPNSADGIDNGTLGGGYTWNNQYYGVCLTYTGTAGNAAGQGWITNYFILKQPASGQVLKYNTSGAPPVWFNINLATDINGGTQLLAANFPALTGAVTSAGGTLSTSLGAQAFAQIMSRVCRGA